MDNTEQNPEKIQHIGDGVYAGFDGYHITLRVNDHRNEPVVLLDFHVMKALVEYAKARVEEVSVKTENPVE